MYLGTHVGLNMQGTLLDFLKKKVWKYFYRVLGFYQNSERNAIWRKRNEMWKQINKAIPLVIIVFSQLVISKVRWTFRAGFTKVWIVIHWVGCESMCCGLQTGPSYLPLSVLSPKLGPFWKRGWCWQWHYWLIYWVLSEASSGSHQAISSTTWSLWDSEWPQEQPKCTSNFQR